MWSDLKETYDRVDGSIVFNMYQKINSVRQNGSSVSEYYHRLNTMWKQFDAIVQLPTCVCQALKEFNGFNTMIKLMQFLMGLDDVYQPVRTNLLMSDPLPTVKHAFSIVSREESHRGSSGNTKSQNVAFISKGQPNQTFENKKQFNRGPNPNLKCSHCNMIGHTVDRCYELVGYPPGFKKKNANQNKKQGGVSSSAGNKSNTASASTGLPFSAEQISKLMSLINEKGTTSECQNSVGGNSFVGLSNVSVIRKLKHIFENFSSCSTLEKNLINKSWITDLVLISTCVNQKMICLTA